MGIVRITKIFRFEMAHYLWNHEGKCKNIHGHSYVLHVTISGNPKNEKGNPEDGMLIDFGRFQNIIKEIIIDKFDHSFVVNANSNKENNFLKKEFNLENIKALPFQPTSENIIIHFAELIKKALPNNLILYSLKLSETNTSYVEWFEENK